MLFSRVDVAVGPFDAELALRPGLRGGTEVDLGPLGGIELDTHSSPISIEATVEELRPEDAQAIAEDPSRLIGLADEITSDVRSGLRRLAVRGVLVAVAGGAIGAAVSGLRVLRIGTGAAAGAILAAAIGGAAAATWRAEAIAEPRYTGLLSFAPRAVGEVDDIRDRFDQYSTQLAGLVGNVALLYRTASDLPILESPEDRATLLHVSDIHLNPAAFELIAQLVRQFRVDAVLDSGDMTDWGTAPEATLLDTISSLGVPYVFVRGNHDSPAIEAAVAAQPNGMVLDGDGVTIAGISIWGIGDPRFTPDKSQPTGADVERQTADRFAPTVARRLRQTVPRPDVLLVHDRRVAASSGDLVDLILSGHTHNFREGRIGDALSLTQGSTGGAGLRSLEQDEPEPLTATVLHFDSRTRRLLAYDQVTVSGLGGSGVTIRRRVITRPPSGISAAEMTMSAG